MENKAEEEIKTKQIIETHRYCVLATASLTGQTEAAVIEYVPEESGVLYFETSTQFRKYPHLKENPRASIVIHEGLSAVQMDGLVEELPREGNSHAIQLMIEKFGRGTDFYAHEHVVFFKFTPTWIQYVYRDHTWPPQIFILPSLT